MTRFARTFAVAFLLLGAATGVRAATLDAIEYYNAPLDHYFVTALADEIAKLDAGVFAGWRRTGQRFTVFDPATPVTGASPVCRFYGVPAAGLDSHFYSASPAECQAVLKRFAGAWIEETDNAFGIFLPDTTSGQCPSGTVPVYRAWNGRVDSNHRFTTDPATLKAMVAKGYIAEGYGPAAMPVAMCSPVGATGAVPACVVSASNATPTIGGNVTLTASCTNGPLAFTWTNCMSASAQCTATSSNAGTATYSVVATNNAGSSAPSSVQVVWQAPSSSAPRCTIVYTSQGTPPTVKGSVALQANCSGGAIGSYAWNGCSSSTQTCIARETAPGNHTYSVIGRSSGGSSPPATLTLNWVSGASPAPGFCGSFPSYLHSDIGSQTVRVESILMPAPAFAWNGVWTVRFVVPATMSAASVGRMSSAEFAGPPTLREVTISKTPCDFRPTDPSGAGGPIARQAGSSNTIQFTTSATRPGYPVLTPGGVYYYSVRNFQPSNGTITCSSSPGRCDALVESVLPTR